MFLRTKLPTSATIPSSVTSIGNNAFDHCGSLTNIYYTGTQEQWYNISIGTCNYVLTKATTHFNCSEE